MSRPIPRPALPPPPPARSPVAWIAGALVLAVVTGGLAVAFLRSHQPGPGAMPLPSVAASAETGPAASAPAAATADEAREEALAITTDVRKLVDRATAEVIAHPKGVKPPYAWRSLPARYRKLAALVRGKPWETELLLAHARHLSVSYAKLSSAVTKDPDGPTEAAPALLTMDAENTRGKDFEETIREVAGVIRAQMGARSAAVVLVQCLFLMLSGDTRAATAELSHLPPGSTGELATLEEGVRALARSLLAYGMKKGTRPIEWTRRGLAALEAGAHAGDRASREWSLILLYAGLPSLFHEDYGRRESAPDLVDRALQLTGRDAGSTRAPEGLDPLMVAEVDAAIATACHRGLDLLAHDLSPTAPPVDLATGARCARWLALATDPGGEGPLWYAMVLKWLAPATPVLATSTDPGVRTALARLDTALAARQASEETGVFSAARARVAQARGDVAAARTFAAAARTKAAAAGFEQKDPGIWEALTHLESELATGKR